MHKKLIALAFISIQAYCMCIEPSRVAIGGTDGKEVTNLLVLSNLLSQSEASFHVESITICMNN